MNGSYLAFLVVFLSAAVSHAQENLISCTQGTGRVLTLGSGIHKLEPNCDFHGGFLINNSNTILDCQGSTLWGVPTEQRALLVDKTGEAFGNMIESGEVPTVVGRGITVESTEAISDIQIRNCKIKDFKQAIRLKHKDPGATWFWNFVDQDPILQPLHASYTQSKTTEAKEQLLSAFRDHTRWESSPLPDTIRAATPRNVRFENVEVDLTAMSGVYVDHHVTGVTFDGLSVNRAYGPGIYFEFGSRANVVKNSRFTNGGREGIALDSSEGNLIQYSEFSNNKGGGVFLYRNCWEYFTDLETNRGNYFPRTQGSDNNRIYNNSFFGNGSLISRTNVGVWIASRQSKRAPFVKDNVIHGCGLYRMLPANEGYWYHEDRARNVQVVGNLFDSLTEGVIVEDDGSRIFGNRFESTVQLPVEVGTVIRTEWRGTPVLNSRVAFQVIYQNADEVPLSDVVSVLEQRPEYRLETRVCSIYGRLNRTTTDFSPSCTEDYLNILRNGGFVDSFQGAVRSRIELYYPPSSP